MPFAFLFGLYVTSPKANEVYYSVLISPNRGTFSTIFLYMVNVKKSRIECEQFIEAEMKRQAFDDAA